MLTLVVDVESYYDQEYSLRKMTPVEYILDPRWETIGWAVKANGGKTHWLTDAQFRKMLAGLPPEVTMVSHNALFDMCVLAWRYDYVPTLMIDTLGMARAWMGHKMRSLALVSLARYMGLGVKGDTVQKVMGMGLAAIKAAGFYDEYAEYSKGDADLCWGIYRALIAQGFPAQEIVVMDSVIRCAVQPEFVLDRTLLAEHLNAVLSQKQALMDRIGVHHHDSIRGGATVKEVLMSNDMFATALRALGVEPPTKISLTTGKEAYAFAKTDADFIGLEEHENPDVQALVSARLGVKSTIEESRTQRLLSIANLTWPGNQQQLLPIPLRFSGAHTHRLCLVGATTIVALRDNRVVYTRLDGLLLSDLIWDGEEFVRHQGLVYAGIKKVMTYDGITGTPDHRVRTVEHGYLPLEEAKARGYDIARGGLPNPTRINPTVYRLDRVQGPGKILLLPVWPSLCVAVEGLAPKDEGMVQVMRYQGEDARGVTFAGNAGRGDQSQRRGYVGAASCLGDSPGSRAGEAFGKSTGENPVAKVAASGLGDRAEDCHTGTRPLHESEGVELPVLRGEGYPVYVPLDGDHGGLAAGKSGCTVGRPVAGSDRMQRPLPTGELALGDESGTGAEQEFLPTYDIVNCGPRSCFMANGRVVHNSGDWKLNMQNLPARGNNRIRSAMQAPDGHKVVAVDASQIEARIAGWFCGCTALTSAFANKEDVYSTFASKVFGRFIDKKTDPVGRFIGKTAVLGLQYNLGWLKFQGTVAVQSKAQLGTEVVLDDVEAAQVVRTYRQTYHEIPAMWRRLDGLIAQMTSRNCHVVVGPVTFMHEKIRLPNGLYLHYHELKYEGGQWTFTYAGKPKYLYGGKLLENIVQALARICVMDAAVRVRRQLDREGRGSTRLNLQVHDELVYIEALAHAERLRDMVIHEMCHRPTWAPDLPLDAEGGIGGSYGECK